MVCAVGVGGVITRKMMVGAVNEGFDRCARGGLRKECSVKEATHKEK